MNRLLGVSLVVGALCWVVWASDVEAGHPYGGWGWGPYRYYASPYYPSDRRIPYFAEHPPVYYSAPVARTYGLSPYAYPPTYEPAVPVEPLMVPNPHVEAEPSAADPDERITRRVPKPLIVENPYVSGDSSVARAP